MQAFVLLLKTYWTGTLGILYVEKGIFLAHSLNGGAHKIQSLHVPWDNELETQLENFVSDQLKT